MITTRPDSLAAREPYLDTPQTDATPTRRTFLTIGIYVVGAAIGAGLAIPVVGYFIAPATKASGTDKVWADVGAVADLQKDNKPTQADIKFSFPDGFKTVDRNASLFVRYTGNEFQVFSNICTHLGCPVSYDDGAKQFKCPCHGSVFNEDGTVAHGPAPLPLAKYDVRTQGDKLQVDALSYKKGLT